MQAIDGDGDVLTPPIKLALVQRAKRILQSKQFKPESSRPPRKRRRGSSSKSDKDGDLKRNARDGGMAEMQRDFLLTNSDLLDKCLSSEAVDDLIPPPEVSCVVDFCLQDN